MRRQELNLLASYGIIAAVFIAVIVGMGVLRSYWESESYNRLTGAKTTTWDAMFLELRIQAEPKE